MSTRRSLVIGAVLLAFGLIVASHASAAPPCDNSSLNGSYGVKFEGQSQTLGRIASVSIWTFNGQGGLNVSEVFTSDATGPQTRTIVGSYSVLSNCGFTFTSTLTVGGCVLVDGAKEFSCLDVEPGRVATFVGKKI